MKMGKYGLEKGKFKAPQIDGTPRSVSNGLQLTGIAPFADPTSVRSPQLPGSPKIGRSDILSFSRPTWRRGTNWVGIEPRDNHKEGNNLIQGPC
jgi:hypothetical protein